MGLARRDRHGYDCRYGLDLLLDGFCRLQVKPALQPQAFEPRFLRQFFLNLAHGTEKPWQFIAFGTAAIYSGRERNQIAGWDTLANPAAASRGAAVG